jgi:hypothetical protein
VGLTTLPPTISRMSRQYGILNISQPNRPPQSVTGIVFFTSEAVIAQLALRWDVGWGPGWVRICSLHHIIQTGSGAHPASYSTGTGALSAEVKRPECEAHHSPSPIAETKSGGAIPALHILLRDEVIT